MLKTKTISTDKATLLVVEMPEGVNEYHHSRAGVSLSQGDGSYLFISGNWQILGRLPDITEGQFEKIVDSGDQEPGNDKYILKWKDYEVANVGEECPYMDYSLDTATESFYSLLQANEVYFENPLGEEPEKAQKHVWVKDRTYLLVKEE